MDSSMFREAPVLARKGVELLLRTIGEAPEQRSARKLVARIPARPAPCGPRVLVLTPRSWAAHVQYESVIAHGLRARGADVRFLTCGGGLEICDRANTYEAPPMPCRTCTRYTSVALDAHAFPVSRMADVWNGDDGSWPELDEVPADALSEVEAEGLPLGRLVDIPVKWFLCAADLDADPLAGSTTRAFLRSARRIARAVNAALDEHRPDTVLLLNGLFLFESIAWAACEARGIDVVTYERAFRKETIVMSRGAAAGLYDFSATWPQERRPLRPSEAAELDGYLASRRAGQAFDQYWKWEEHEVERGRGHLAVLFTNLTWDTAVIGRDLAFPSIGDWVATTIRTFAELPDHRLVVRVHPAEVALPGQRTRDSLAAFIDRAFPVLPPNVVMIRPDDRASSYPLMDACDLGLVYTSTTGLELALTGKPVIVAGATHYRGKGFTADVDSRASYAEALRSGLEDPASLRQDLELARQYAHFFFFRAPLSAPGVQEPLPGLARLTIDDPSQLLPGADAALDRICDGILTGSSFVAG